MRKRTFRAPTAVLAKCGMLGETGAAWLGGLGDLVERLEREWGIAAGNAMSGGSEAFVAEATTRDGRSVVLKLAMPEMEGNGSFENEALALRLADGRGYAALLACDAPGRAMLLERLGEPLSEAGLPPEEQRSALCAALRASWAKVPDGAPLPTGAAIADWHAGFIAERWGALQPPCGRRALDRALACAASRRAAYDPASAVLVHGDAHSGNALRDVSGEGPAWKFVDPDGLRAEPAYDLGILMREWPEELSPDPVRNGRARCAALQSLAGVDAAAIWEWGYLQCMSTGLFLLQLGQEREGLRLLRIAEAWAEEEPFR